MIDADSLVFLYAEDDPDDRLLADMAHRESESASRLAFVGDGEEALEYLRRTGRYADRAHGAPAVVLLDLNMPGIDGRETLRIIRADPGLRNIPVVILTTSAAADDIEASHEAGADAYIVKPRDFAGLVRIFTTLSSFQFDISKPAKDGIR